MKKREDVYSVCLLLFHSKNAQKIQVESEKLGRGFKGVSFTVEIVQNRNPVFNTYL